MKTVIHLSPFFIKIFIKKSVSYSYGGKETRTPDICLAKAALYQLSYTPMWAIQDLNPGPHPYQGCALTN
jgi:hypothetical protein